MTTSRTTIQRVKRGTNRPSGKRKKTSEITTKARSFRSAEGNCQTEELARATTVTPVVPCRMSIPETSNPIQSFDLCQASTAPTANQTQAHKSAKVRFARVKPLMEI